MIGAMPVISLDQARAARLVAVRRLRKLDNLTAIGITKVDGGYAIKVNLSEPLQPGLALPSQIDGVPLRIEVTGVARAR
jgi:hypothetical protein